MGSVNMMCPFHSFEVSTDEAKLIQRNLKKRVKLSDAISDVGSIRYVGGADVAFIETFAHNPRKINKSSNNRKKAVRRSRSQRLPDMSKAVTALAALVVLDSCDLSIVETAIAAAPVTYPYIPGFLSFREGRAILSALGKLSILPDVMIYDGCGIAHPRGFGLASHMAVMTGIPSVGCAKSNLVGTYDIPGQMKGSWSEICYKDSVVGQCVRTRDNVRPVFVSPGSGFSINGAREAVLALTTKYRLPEPTRRAHNIVTAKKRTEHH